MKGNVGATREVDVREKKTILSLFFLVAVGVTLYVYAFKIEVVKSTLSDLWGLLGGLILAWVIGFVFYRLNLQGSRNTTKREFAEFIGWAKRQPETDYSNVGAQLIRKAAIAVLIGGTIAFIFLWWMSRI
jgi:hydrogenase-4 membrane subunit HyfE